MTQLGNSRRALKIPVVDPQTQEDHRTNNSHLEQWANALPVPKVKLIERTGLAQSTDITLVTFTAVSGTPYRVDYYVVITGGSDIASKGILITPTPTKNYALVGGLPSIPNAIGTSFVSYWTGDARPEFAINVALDDPGTYNISGVIQLTELEQLP